MREELDDMKSPLFDLKLEDGVLGAIMLEQDSLIDNMDSLHDNLFYKETHKIIFRAIKTLFDKRAKIDILTVSNKLRELNEIENVGGAYYISQLTSNIASSANIEYHIKILTQLFLKRRLGEICGETFDRVKNFSTDVLEEKDSLQQKLSDLDEHTVGKDYEVDMDKEIDKRMIYHATKRDNHVTGVPTGNDLLNNITKGWQKKNVYIMAARSSMGKTAKAIELSLEATRWGYKPIIFSLEMSIEEMIDRLLTNESSIGSDTVKNQSWTPSELIKFQEAAEALKRSGAYIIDNPMMSINSMRTIIRILKRRFGNKMLIIIDYIQLMKAGGKFRNREEEVAVISRGIKSISKELDVPIIALSQLNRDVEKRSDKRPILSDLRESGSIEQDADMVLFLYRPSYYYVKNDDPDYKSDVKMSDEEYNMLTEIIIAKHRNGSLGRIKEYFHNDKSKFTKEFNQPVLLF